LKFQGNSTEKVFHEISELLETLKDFAGSASPEFVMPESHQQIAYQLPRPITQGNYEDVQADVKLVTKRCQEVSQAVPTAAIIVERDLAAFEILNEFREEASISFSEMPSMASIRGTLSVGKFQKHHVILIRGGCYSNQGLPPHQQTHIIRVLGMLKIEKLVIVGSVCSTNDNLVLGQIVPIKDHVMISGRNPLFGKNEDRWGTRFPDISHMYNAAMLQSVKTSLASSQLASDTTVVAHFIGPVFASPAQARFASHYQLDSITTGMIPETMVACHMGIPVGAVGVVVGTLGSKISTLTPSDWKGREALETAIGQALDADVKSDTKH